MVFDEVVIYSSRVISSGDVVKVTNKLEFCDSYQTTKQVEKLSLIRIRQNYQINTSVLHIL